MIYADQRKRIEEKLRDHPDQSPEFQAYARETLEKQAHEYNERNNVVGYKRPPRDTRFKKGNPGGPGRPKKDHVYRAFLSALNQDNQKLLKEIVQTTIARAIKGERRAMKTLIEITEPRLK